MKRIILSLCIALAGTGAAAAADNVLHVRVDNPGAEVQPTMYGLFFEDINFAADGGLYAEMIKNRSFEFPQALMGWRSFGNVELRDEGGPFARNPHYVRLMPAGHSHKHTGLDNEGFFGVSLQKDSVYDFSVYARSLGPGEATLRVELVNPSAVGGQVLATRDISVAPGEWRRYEAQLTPASGVDKGRLRIFLEGDCGADVEHVSLFPANAWHGLRADLVELLADIQPGVFRFPGGCIVEGTDLESRYQWKNSVGPAENRPLNENRWHYTFPHRFFPDYYQSYGLGFYEYFLLSEHLGAAPLPVLNVGLSCQYQNYTEDAHVPLDSLQPYIDDVLDLIEFANGPVDSEWGSLRASMGHPDSFGLKYVAIGNEQWDTLYTQRLEPFVKAVRTHYPDIKIVGSSGPDPEGEKFDFLWPEMKCLGADLVDEHFYRNEEWFLRNATRYDGYDRRGPAVFAGEYACHGPGGNHFNTALMEAALMTGLERNADIVHMATYAPLFAHVEGYQWGPDMIWFDNTRSYGTASYFVQKLFARNRGGRTLRTSAADGKPLAGQSDLYASAVTNPEGGFIVKVVNVGDADKPLTVVFDGMKKRNSLGSISAITFHSDDIHAENSLDEPARIVPSGLTQLPAPTDRDKVQLTIPARTFGVYFVK